MDIKFVVLSVTTCLQQIDHVLFTNSVQCVQARVVTICDSKLRGLVPLTKQQQKSLAGLGVECV